MRSYDGIGIRLGRCCENRADGDVVGGALRGSLELLEVVRRCTDDFVADDRASGFNAEVVLADVYARGERDCGYVGAVVDDERDSLWLERGSELLGDAEDFTGSGGTGKLAL